MCRGLARATMGGVRVTVLIVDDFAAFRRSARALLEDDGFDVVGEAADGRTALAEVERLRPAVVLLDVQLPDEDGFEIAARMVSRPDPPVVDRPRLRLQAGVEFVRGGVRIDISGRDPGGQRRQGLAVA